MPWAISPARERSQDEEGVLEGGEAQGHDDAVDHGVDRLVIIAAVEGDERHYHELGHFLESRPQGIAVGGVGYDLGDVSFSEDGCDDRQHPADEAGYEERARLGIGIFTEPDDQPDERRQQACQKGVDEEGHIHFGLSIPKTRDH